MGKVCTVLSNKALPVMGTHIQYIPTVRPSVVTPQTIIIDINEVYESDKGYKTFPDEKQTIMFVKNNGCNACFMTHLAKTNHVQRENKEGT